MVNVIRLSRVATVLTVYGIETVRNNVDGARSITVATVLTVYGIETNTNKIGFIKIPWSLQQYLPFTVLKRFRR